MSDAHLLIQLLSGLHCITKQKAVTLGPMQHLQQSLNKLQLLSSCVAQHHMLTDVVKSNVL